MRPMENPFSMLQIMNAALLSQGEEQIVSLNDGSDAYRVLAANWPLIVQSGLEIGNYFFTREQVNITTTTTGKFNYTNAYAIPANTLTVRSAWIVEASGNDNIVLDIDWIQDQSYVYCNETTGIYIERLVSADSSIWSATFTRAVKLALEAVILRAMKEEFNEALKMEQLADLMFEEAKTHSSQARSGKKAYKKGPIASARFVRGYALGDGESW